MRIAQVCMPFIAVPPKGYGAVERVVSYLTEALIVEGHSVTLFASGDSVTRARLVAPCNVAAGDTYEGHLLYLTLLGMVARHAAEFDIIHFHCINWMPLAFIRAVHDHSLITYHMPISRSRELEPVFREFSDVPFVSVSDAQRPIGLSINWKKTIHLGIPASLYSLQKQTLGYYAYIGLLAAHKGVDRAIDIALRAGVPLKIAGPIRNQSEQEYFDRIVAPKVVGTEIEYVGELDDCGKQLFLGGAEALLFPVEWHEVFGLVMVEAMACGTPIIAFERGAVREVVTDGVSGIVVSSQEDAVKAIAGIGGLDRVKCRAEFDRRFSASKMCSAYLTLYQELLS